MYFSLYFPVMYDIPFSLSFLAFARISSDTQKNWFRTFERSFQNRGLVVGKCQMGSDDAINARPLKTKCSCDETTSPNLGSPLVFVYILALGVKYLYNSL